MIATINPELDLIQQSYKEHHRNTIGDMYEHFRIIAKFYIYKNKIMNDDLCEEEIKKMQQDLADGVYELEVPDFMAFCASLNEHDFFFEVNKQIFHCPMKKVW